MKIIIAAIVTTLCSLQDPPVYYPLAPGSSWVYKTPDGSFEDIINEQKFTHHKIDYLQNTRKYSDGTVDITYFRIAKNGAVYYLDNKSFLETLEIPSNPKIAFRWTSADDKWQYEIIEVGAALKTPAHIFKNCIAIKAHSNSKDGMTYINYYSKGIGFVGSKVDGKLIAYLTRWLPKPRRVT
ncbi:hypothetical protein [Chryseolinea lacunae]|uniref:Uncharacterized protein n=1 Tax=Chryseolinea lacunae TaxID=2801331 RepID=A0ABS1KRF3_9BACT|nr:hypothetical protein [Chryseolinea lacunae]MBL0741920.1 hypothetical protein [Chryseolinea lacunae]